MYLKRISCCSFHGQMNFARERFLGGEHLTSASTKTAQTNNFKLCAHISKRLLHKTMPAFLLIMSYSFFYCNNSISFGSILCLKTVKSILFKKYLKRRKSQARLCLCLDWQSISEKKLLNTTILLLQEPIKQEKQLVSGPTLILIFLILGKCTKGKLHILKKVDLSTFKEI